MKKIFLFGFMAFFTISVYSQQTKALSGPKELRSVDGYVIRLLPAMHGGYGYDILQNNKPVVHQVQNPLPFAPKGIQQAEDAFTIAQWQIKEYKAHGRWPGMISPHAARALNIQTH